LGRSAEIQQGSEFKTDGKRNEEHHDQLHRFRRAATIAVIAWPFFGLVDWYIVSFVSPGRLWFCLALRAVGLVALLIAVAQTFGRKEPSSRKMRWVDATVSSVLTILITISSLEFGGIASPVSVGVVLVLAARGFVFTDHWKRGILPVGMVVLSFPITLIVMGMFVPHIAAQFADSQVVAAFLLNLIFITATGAIAVSGSHLVWTLRRQLYQSRALGRYKLKKRIGAGGMGEIWLAHHNALRRDVAVKILRPENVGDSRAIARFEREVRATSELVHPNTVRVFDYGVTSDGLWYYAMELLEGSDLHAEISKRGPMHPNRAALLIGQACRALSEAHSRGIIHRDLKPENLFLTNITGQGEFIKILDFGLAKLMDTRTESQEGLTQVGWAVGTPQWVSPEVMLGEDADERSDIYGLGAILYFLLCAQSPYGEHEISKVMRAHRKETPKRPSIRISQPVHGKLEDVVMCCLEKDPAKRYQSAIELEVALKASMRPEAPTQIMGPNEARPWENRKRAESSAPTDERRQPNLKNK